MSTTAIPPSAATRKFDLVDDLIEEFERRWRAGRSPQLSSFLNLPAIQKVTADERQNFLVELILVDLEYRWRDHVSAQPAAGAATPKPTTAGTSAVPVVEDYVAAYAELASDEDVLCQLVEEEFRVRQRHGDAASVEDFVARFPQLEARLRQKLPLLATILRRVDEAAQAASQVSSSLRDFRIPLTSQPTPKSPDAVSQSTDGPVPSVWTLRNARVNLLSKVKPFCNFSSTLISQLAECMSERDFARNEWLSREGEAADELRIITGGEVSVVASDGKGGVRVIERKKHGDIVGVFSMVTGQPHLVSAQATSTVKALCISATDYAAVVGRSPILAIMLAELICKNTAQKSVDAFCGKLVGDNRIRRRIASGSMSVIYKAESPTGETVALKMLKHHLALDREAKSRFLREADILKALQHPNIVRFHESIEAFGTSFHVLEHCGSATLAEAITNDAPFSEAQVRNVIGQLASALSYAHRMGVVHRDLKPSTILLRDDGSVLLIDFGLSRSAQSMALTQWGEILGTPGYMPPEQLIGTPVTETADLYSLGCVTYEMLTGRPLFETNDEMDLLHEKLRLPPQVKQLAGRVSPGMYSLLCGSLAVNSDDRVLKLESIANW